MFAFRRKSVVNTLTTLINSKKEAVTVREVLGNAELSTSIRNELPELLNFFSFPPGDTVQGNSCLTINTPPLPSIQPANSLQSPSEEANQIPSTELPRSPAPTVSVFSMSHKRILSNQKELSTLAFSNFLNKRDEDYLNEDHYRFNRNAANILSSPSAKFHSRLITITPTVSPFMKELLRFIHSLQKKHHPSPQFYGHFARIFESMMRTTKGNLLHQLYTLDPSISPFYKILLDHIPILSIRQLYAMLANDHSALIAGDEDETEVFNQLAILASDMSSKIKGKKYRRITKRYVTREEFDKLRSQFGVEQCGTDSLGYRYRRKYIERPDSSDVHVVNTTNYTIVEQDGHEFKKKKVHRIDYLQKTSYLITTIKTIISDKPEQISFFQNKIVIEKLMEVGQNLNESSSLLDTTYKLVLLILTKNTAADEIDIINDYRDIFDQERFSPSQKDFEDLFSRQDGDYKGIRLCLKMPFYFVQFFGPFVDYFFQIEKSFDEYDRLFIQSFNKLSDSQIIELINQYKDKFIQALCNILPEPPKDVKMVQVLRRKRMVKVVEPMTKEEEDFMNSQANQKHKPLSGFIWKFAKYITSKNIFSSEIRDTQEWKDLKDKVSQYYLIVNKFQRNEYDQSSEEDEDNTHHDSE